MMPEVWVMICTRFPPFLLAILKVSAKLVISSRPERKAKSESISSRGLLRLKPLTMVSNSLSIMEPSPNIFLSSGIDARNEFSVEYPALKKDERTARDSLNWLSSSLLRFSTRFFRIKKG